MTAPQALDVFRCPLQGLQLIEASAGTGKTWAICGLVLRLLLERELEVHQLLVVTFTQAATAELRERVRARIAQTLACLRSQAPSRDVFVDTLLETQRARGQSDDTMSRRLEQALQTFDEAAIFTIHGFCQRALADTAFSSGLPLDLQASSDTAALELQVARDFWRRLVGAGALHPAVARWLGERGDSPERWAEVLRQRLARPLAKLRWPHDLPARAASLDTEAQQQAHRAARACWQRERDAIIAIAEEAWPRLPKGSYKPEALPVAVASWDAVLASVMPTLKRSEGDKLDLLTERRMQPKGKQAPPQPHPFFALAQALLDAVAANTQALQAQRLLWLRELLEQGPAACRQAQQAARVIGFDSMLTQLHERLAAPGGQALARRLQQRFPAVLIDEFQDTDPLQYAIFRTICRDSTLFLVGDPKQAIYSFRSADLHTYLQARRHAAALYTLAHNQRSSQALLQAQNALLCANPRAFVQEGLQAVPVQMGDKQRATFVDHSAPRAALQLWQLPGDETGQPLRHRRALALALQACAGEIARLLQAAQQGQVQLAGAPLRGGDIAVLVRTHRQGAAMAQALAALGVASVELSQAHLHRSTDAAELEQVLAAIDEPQREDTLRAALATELMGFTAEAIDALDGQDSEVQRWMQRFAELRRAWHERGVAPMLRRWMAQHEVAARLLARPDGERRMTNLLHLIERLQQAAAVHSAPEAQLRWLQQQRQNPQADDTAQLRLESDRQLVQIVTLHRAKGLEYPLVFCPTLFEGESAERSSGRPGKLWHDDEGQAWLDFSDDADSKAAKLQRQHERWAEHLRLAYVAITRAVHRCTVVVGPYIRNKSSKHSSRSAMAWWAAGAGVEPANWIDKGLPPATIEAAWQALANQHPGAIGLMPLPAGQATALSPDTVGRENLQALQPPAVPPGWRIGSFTALMRGGGHDGNPADHDQRLPADPLDADAPAAVIDDHDVLHFPRGPAAGVCLHLALERADFSDPASWPAAIASALQESPLPADRPLAPMLQSLFGALLQTEIAPGLRLAEIDPARRLTELEFKLPVQQLDAAALGRLLTRLGHPVPLPPFATLQGYLHGFVDLVFEHQGRYHLVDWKSNHLGMTAADYAPAALVQPMQAHGYTLQALLYAVALHRLLQMRLPDYQPERHFGSVMFLFVRGVRPSWPAGSGVATLRPDAAALQQLSALFEGGGP